MKNRKKINNSIKKPFHFIGRVYIHFLKDNGFMLAASMVYSTLFSLVPFLAFIAILLSDLKIIDTKQLRDIVQRNIAKHILPDNQDIITNYINQFTESATTLGWIGLLFFLITSIFLIKKVNDTFNLIYKATPKQGLMSRFATYITSMIVGTLFVGVFIAVTKPIQKTLSTNNILNLTDLNISIFSNFVPWIILFLSLYIMIKKIPSAKVERKSAIIGAFFGTIAWQVTNKIFSYSVSKMFTYHIIYKSLASAMFFLLWLNFIWIIIYMSLEMTYVHQYKKNNFNDPNRSINNPHNKFAFCFDTIRTIISGFSSGTPLSEHNLAKKLAIPENILRPILFMLENQNLIIKTNDSPARYVPAKALDKIKIEDIIKATYGIKVQQESESFGDKISSEILNSTIQSFNHLTASDLLAKNFKKKKS